MSLRDDYECLGCKETFEYNKPYGEEFPESPVCPICGSKKTKRKLTKRNAIIPEHMRSVNN